MSVFDTYLHLISLLKLTRSFRLAVQGKSLPQVAPHLWPDYEPPESDEDNDEKNYDKAVKMWLTFGFTIEKAREMAGLPPLP